MVTAEFKLRGLPTEKRSYTNRERLDQVIARGVKENAKAGRTAEKLLHVVGH